MSIQPRLAMAAAALFFGVIPALGDEVIGEITAIDRAANSITLDDGKTYPIVWSEGQMIKVLTSQQQEEQGVIKGMWIAEQGATPAEGETVGALTDLDLEDGMVQLSDGGGFRWGWDVGSKVKLTYENNQAGLPQVTAIESAN